MKVRAVEEHLSRGSVYCMIMIILHQVDKTRVTAAFWRSVPCGNSDLISRAMSDSVQLLVASLRGQSTHIYWKWAAVFPRVRRSSTARTFTRKLNRISSIFYTSISISLISKSELIVTFFNVGNFLKIYDDIR